MMAKQLAKKASANSRNETGMNRNEMTMGNPEYPPANSTVSQDTTRMATVIAAEIAMRFTI